MDGSDTSPQVRGRERGADTREQLINTGLRLFATHGYHGVTTRMVTKEAGANLAAINYHFGGKQGLYAAVIGDIAANMRQLTGPIGRQLREAIEQAGDDRQALALAVHSFCIGFLSALIGETSRRPMVGLVMREFAVPTQDFSILYDNAIEPLHKTLSLLVAAADRNPDPSDPEVIMRAHTVLGMCMSFIIARVILCRRMDWQDYTPERVTAIAEAVASVMLPALNLPEITREAANG